MLPSNSIGYNEDMNESGIIARTFPGSGRLKSEWTPTRRLGIDADQNAAVFTGSACVCEQCHVTVGTLLEFCAHPDVRQCATLAQNRMYMFPVKTYNLFNLLQQCAMFSCCEPNDPERNSC